MGGSVWISMESILNKALAPLVRFAIAENLPAALLRSIIMPQKLIEVSKGL